MNWTTTTVPLWQVDCENFRTTGQAFELRDISTEEHRNFIQIFSARFGLLAKIKGDVALFQGSDKKKTGPVSISTRLAT